MEMKMDTLYPISECHPRISSPANSFDLEPNYWLPKKLDEFRMMEIGCDVVFIVGEEKEVCFG